MLSQIAVRRVQFVYICAHSCRLSRSHRAVYRLQALLHHSFCCIWCSLAIHARPMKAYKNPFGGRRAPGDRRAPRQKKFKKKKVKGDGDQPSGSKRSPWGLLGAVGSFAAVFIFTIWKSQEDSKTKRLSDKRVLNAMMYKPMVYTDHAICRMKCR